MCFCWSASGRRCRARTSGSSSSAWRACARWCSGPIFALFQHDLKGLLAYSTISHLGLITVLLGFGSPLAAVAAIFHMMNHATFKASLFMAAGIIDHETGTRDMRRLSGLVATMPITATLAMVACAAMAGVPLLNGFLSKEMFFAEAVETHRVSLLDSAAPYVATVAAAFAVAYSLRFIHTVFFGPPPSDLPRVPHEPPHWMRLPGRASGVGLPHRRHHSRHLHRPLPACGGGVGLGRPAPATASRVWHGFNLPLLMSVIAMVGGIASLRSASRSYLSAAEEGPPGAAPA